MRRIRFGRAVTRCHCHNGDTDTLTCGQRDTIRHRNPDHHRLPDADHNLRRTLCYFVLSHRLHNRSAGHEDTLPVNAHAYAESNSPLSGDNAAGNAYTLPRQLRSGDLLLSVCSL